MPLLKYTLLVGSSLLALLFVAEHMIAPTPQSTQASTSLDVLRKMANHGEARGFAPLAYAGDFLPMPMVAAQPFVAAEAAKPELIVGAPRSAALDAQARIAETAVIDQPPRRAALKKVATRKPSQPRNDYVENLPRGPFGFLGVTQSW